MNTIQIGYRIKELREAKNLNQEELSKILNIEQSTLSYYENNKRRPSLEVLIKMANFFGVSLDYICDRYKKAQ